MLPKASLLALLAIVGSCSRPTTPVGSDASPVPAEPPISSAIPARVAPGVPEVGPPGVYMGRVMAEPMSYRGADWLDRPDRDATQKPEHVLDVLGVRERMVVADIGCGSGYFTMSLSKRVGPQGRVVATDLQKEMLDILAKKLRDAKTANVSPIRATADDARLPSAELDLALMVDVYHELPNPPATLAQIKKALKPGGRLALVEYRAEDPKVEIKPEHKTTLAQLRLELGANGWHFLSSDESLPEQRIVLFEPDPKSTVVFDARVTSVVPKSAYGGEAYVVDADPRFVATMKVESIASGEPPWKTGVDPAFAIHSPSRTFAAENPLGIRYLVRAELGATPTFAVLLVR